MSSVREDIAEMFKIARQEGALRKWADGLSDADEVLSHPRIGVIAEDQSLPDVRHSKVRQCADEDGVLTEYLSLEWKSEVQTQKDMLQANFKRIEAEE